MSLTSDERRGLYKMGDARLAYVQECLKAGQNNPDALPTNMGLKDTDKLYDVILPRKHVKAVVFGHTHKRSATKVEDVHLIINHILVEHFQALLGSERPWVV